MIDNSHFVQSKYCLQFTEKFCLRFENLLCFIYINVLLNFVSFLKINLIVVFLTKSFQQSYILVCLNGIILKNKLAVYFIYIYK